MRLAAKGGGPGVLFRRARVFVRQRGSEDAATRAGMRLVAVALADSAPGSAPVLVIVVTEGVPAPHAVEVKIPAEPEGDVLMQPPVRDGDQDGKGGCMVSLSPFSNQGTRFAGVGE